MGGDDDSDDDDEMDEDDENFLDVMGKGKDWDDDAQRLWEEERRGGLGLEDDELKDLMADYLKGEGGVADLEDDEDEDSELEEWEQRELAKAKKSAGPDKASKQAAKKQKQKEKKAAAASSSKPKKSIFPTLEEPTPTFSNPTASTSSKKARSSSKPSPSTSTTVDDPHSESTTLTLADSSAKASARHSLRFHTSKIDSASARRSSARQGRMGGDEDIPYRNKQAGRDAALRKNAPKGAVGQDTDLDGAEWGEEDRKTARDVKGLDRELGAAEDMEGDDGYYQLVKKRKREEKEEKQEAYDEVRDAQRSVCSDAFLDFP